MDKPNRLRLINSTFTPATPLRDLDLFCGRVDQIQDVIAAIQEPGRHAVLFGERGVGKSSLANIVGELLIGISAEVGFNTAKVNAEGSDTYGTIWYKIVRRLGTPSQERIGRANDIAVYQEDMPPAQVLETLESVDKPLVLIVDEYDRVTSEDTKKRMADTLKGISDTLPRVTIMLVGVARTIHELVGNHPSVQRNLRQIEIPRMERAEMNDILDKGLSRFEMSLEHEARQRVLDFAAGFPHYVHLLGKYTCIHAATRDDTNATLADLKFGIEEALEEVHESVRNGYHQATITTRRGTLSKPILSAAAQAPKDDRGTFRATDVAAIASSIMNRDVDVASVYNVFANLCSSDRGSVLEKVGSPRNYRYRFSDPLMEAYVRIRGYHDEELHSNGASK